jgi:hypothetical protein
VCFRPVRFRRGSHPISPHLQRSRARRPSKAAPTVPSSRKSLRLQPRMLGVPFQPQPQRDLVPFCIDCCGDELAMAKDMPFLFLSLLFAVISARSGCERQSPRTSTAGGLGRDEGTTTLPESLPSSLFGRCRSDDGPPPSKPGSHMPYASSNCLLGILDEDGIHAPLFARTAERSRARHGNLGELERSQDLKLSPRGSPTGVLSSPAHLTGRISHHTLSADPNGP